MLFEGNSNILIVAVYKPINYQGIYILYLLTSCTIFIATLCLVILLFWLWCRIRLGVSLILGVWGAWAYWWITICTIGGSYILILFITRGCCVLVWGGVFSWVGTRSLIISWCRVIGWVLGRSSRIIILLVLFFLLLLILIFFDVLAGFALVYAEGDAWSNVVLCLALQVAGAHTLGDILVWGIDINQSLNSLLLL